jgi:hypothetical protein
MNAMTKFICLKNGTYINLNEISLFFIKARNDYTFSVIICKIMPANEEFGECFDDQDREWTLISNLNSREEAQEWLDKFMLTHGVCLAMEDNN